VVLFDEVEKAHNDVMNILLGVLDDGRWDLVGGISFFCRFLARARAGVRWVPTACFVVGCPPELAPGCC
jgi:hypothetical protein